MKRFLAVVACGWLTLAPADPGWSKGDGMGKGTLEREGTVIRLPKPRMAGGTSVEAALQNRRSIRNYSADPLTVAEIAQLLWAAQGVTSGDGRRAAPSAGALYPLELYFVAGEVADLGAGIYRYRPADHTLVLVQSGDLRGELAQAALRQRAVKNAPASLVFTAVYQRTTGKYGERGVRYVHMDFGCASENVYLQAVALGLGTVIIGAFDDEALAKVISAPPAEKPLAVMPVGRRNGDR